MNPPLLLWAQTAQLPLLAHQQVHVSAWDLDLPPTPDEWKILAEDETVRARRFVFPRDRDRFVRAHSTMRRLLAGYAGLLPDKISYSTTAYGKPQLVQSGNCEALQFNLTHSGGIALLAAARSYPLGIDVEMIRPIDQDVADHHFSAHELLSLRSLAEEDWLRGFYRCWTSKEALLKGEGLGLNMPLDAFDVEALPHREPALLAARPPANFAHGWKLVELKPARAAIGMLAIRDHAGEFQSNAVQCFSFTG